MGGTDIGASLSGASSATSGARADTQFRYGDIILGGGSNPNKPWLWIALAIGAVVVAVVFIIRR